MPVSDGAGCQALFDEVLERNFRDYRFALSHRLVVDAYCLQHPDAYCASSKSLMAHLGGLCCAFEHGAAPEVYEALRRSLDGTVALERPPLPAARGALTIAEVRGTPDPDTHARAAERWARTVWEAYADLQPLARCWLAEALRTGRS